MLILVNWIFPFSPPRLLFGALYSTLYMLVWLASLICAIHHIKWAGKKREKRVKKLKLKSHTSISSQFSLKINLKCFLSSLINGIGRKAQLSANGSNPHALSIILFPHMRWGGSDLSWRIREWGKKFNSFLLSDWQFIFSTMTTTTCICSRFTIDARAFNNSLDMKKQRNFVCWKVLSEKWNEKFSTSEDGSDSQLSSHSSHNCFQTLFLSTLLLRTEAKNFMLYKQKMST